MASKNQIFRIFNPSSRTKEDPVEKRRGQLRRAQQVYRDRRTRYVKALEGDLSSSRQREREAVRDKEQLEHTVKGLLHLLEQHSIRVPDASFSLDVPSDWGSQTTSPSSRFDGYSEWPQTIASPFYESGPANRVELQSARVCDTDQVTLGMKFVLKIEEPCLGHIHGDPSKPDEPGGHSLTATSHILCLSSSTQTPRRSSLVPTQDVPRSIMDRLLALAPEVANDGELTPIQAWSEVQRKPLFGDLGVQNLMGLAEKLRDAAKCHGFGAVVDHQVFQNLVRDFLIIKTTF